MKSGVVDALKVAPVGFAVPVLSGESGLGTERGSASERLMEEDVQVRVAWPLIRVLEIPEGCSAAMEPAAMSSS
jgi:hypothetical protein